MSLLDTEVPSALVLTVRTSDPLWAILSEISDFDFRPILMVLT